ncbi:hypothetical protein HQ393_10085 [Chitinibacter bivalviorum]|uniref:Uncharacterized protein n=1 Tax=Chitinibacter bivalviorum TaxID=2739434 RepID=A0A7H9BIT0_9NEIS|nr:hypothetical protein [Chitinibacter bivalviorum]QLG88563.1 hypothetical protein HQ393_10085 [Chitinibacter bivalviorum]
MINKSYEKYIFSLDEASAYLMKSGRNVSVKQLLSAGIVGNIKISAFFDCNGFSTTIYRRLLSENKIHKYGINEISNRRLSGLYEIPQCYLLEIESDGLAIADYVISAEGDEFNPEKSFRCVEFKDLKVKLEELYSYLLILGGAIDISTFDEVRGVVVNEGFDILLQNKKIISITKLAIKAAVQIFNEDGVVPSAESVMERLRNWAKNGVEPDCLIAPLDVDYGVSWRTKNSEERKYYMESLRKTLFRYKSIIRN